MQTSSNDLSRNTGKLVKKVAKPVTIEDLEAKLKKLGLDKDLFVYRGIRDFDKGWKYFVHDIDWFPENRAIFESYSPNAVSRTLTKIYKERQAVIEAVKLEVVEVVKLQSPQLTISQQLIMIESVVAEYGWTVIDNVLYNRAKGKVHNIKISSDRVHFFTNNELRRTILFWRFQNFGEYLEKAFHAKKLEIIDRSLDDRANK